jgi:carbamate kinase
VASNPLIVVALGGNAISPRGVEDASTVWSNVRKAASAIINAYLDGYRIVVTHGNGPQAGYLLEAIESLPPERPRLTLDIIDAMTQGWIGYLLVHSIHMEAARRGLEVEAVAIVTRVAVDPNDEAFQNPTKPIGFYYTREEAERLALERGWTLKPDPRGGYRRVVPSPRPLRVLEASIVRRLAESGVIVVAAGGGGIPVSLRDLSPLEAVIDKDLASSLLASQISADRFVILTDVPGAAINYRKAGEKWLSEVSVAELKKYMAEGHFPPGSMGPKVAAAIQFVESTGRPAVIGSLESAADVINMRSGTRVLPSAH